MDRSLLLDMLCVIAKKVTKQTNDYIYSMLVNSEVMDDMENLRTAMKRIRNGNIKKNSAYMCPEKWYRYFLIIRYKCDNDAHFVRLIREYMIEKHIDTKEFDSYFDTVDKIQYLFKKSEVFDENWKEVVFRDGRNRVGLAAMDREIYQDIDYYLEKISHGEEYIFLDLMKDDSDVYRYTHCLLIKGNKKGTDKIDEILETLGNQYQKYNYPEITLYLEKSFYETDSLKYAKNNIKVIPYEKGNYNSIKVSLSEILFSEKNGIKPENSQAYTRKQKAEELVHNNKIKDAIKVLDSEDWKNEIEGRIGREYVALKECATEYVQGQNLLSNLLKAGKNKSEKKSEIYENIIKICEQYALVGDIWFDIIDYYVEKGSFDSALKYALKFENLLEFNEEISERRLRLQAQIGSLGFRCCNYDISDTYYYKLYKNIKLVNSENTGIYREKSVMGRIDALWKMGNYQKAQKFIDKEIENIKYENDQNIPVENDYLIFMRAGNFAFNRLEYDKAVALAKEAIARFDGTRFKSVKDADMKLTNLYNNLAIFYKNMGTTQAYEKAEEYYKKCIEIRSRYSEEYVEVKLSLAISYNNYACMLAEKKNLLVATEYFQKSISLKEEYIKLTGNKGNQTLAISYYDFADALKSQDTAYAKEKVEAAYKYVMEVYDNSEYEDDISLKVLYSKICCLYSYCIIKTEENLKKAEEYASIAYNNFTEYVKNNPGYYSKDYRNAVNTMFYLALKQKKIKEAQEYYEEGHVLETRMIKECPYLDRQFSEERIQINNLYNESIK